VNKILFVKFFCTADTKKVSNIGFEEKNWKGFGIQWTKWFSSFQAFSPPKKRKKSERLFSIFEAGR
jgi:hypothetical protein